MNAPTYINSTHRALARNPGGLTLDEIAGKIRAKAKKAAEQVRELHDLGMIQTEEEAGQPVYKLVEPSAAAPVCDLVQTAGESQTAPAIGDSEGGESDAPAIVVEVSPKFGHGLSCGSCNDGCPGDPCMVERDSPPIDWTAPEVMLAAANRALGEQLGAIDKIVADYLADPSDISPVRAVEIMDQLIHAQAEHIRTLTRDLDSATSFSNSLQITINALRNRAVEQAEQYQADIARISSGLASERHAMNNAINEADRLRTELAAERQAREALQEQSGDAIDVKRAAMGYLVCATKRKPRRINDEERAKFAALAAVRAGAARADVLAVVPVGTARRGAEWRVKQ